MENRSESEGRIREEDCGFVFTRKKRKVPENQNITSVLSSTVVNETGKSRKYRDYTITLPETPNIFNGSVFSTPKEVKIHKARRSSFGLRGKRASSALGGLCSEPHSSILSQTLYKHISPELPEPLRMKQLILWCGDRALEEMKVEESKSFKKKSKVHAEFKKLIQNVLEAIKQDEISTSWYRRVPNDNEDDEAKCDARHEQNIENEYKKKEYEAVMKGFEKEAELWKTLSREYSTLHASKSTEVKRVPLELKLEENKNNYVNIDLQSMKLCIEEVAKKGELVEEFIRRLGVFSKTCENYTEAIFKNLVEEHEKRVPPIDALPFLLELGEISSETQ